MARLESVCQTCGFVAAFETDPGGNQASLPAMPGFTPTNRCPLCMAHNWTTLPQAPDTSAPPSSDPL